MVKDLLKSLNSIHNDNKLSLEEKFLLTVLIKYHSCNLNYAYPPYEVLMTECSTTRKAKISKIVKSLSEKGYITIKKAKGNKNLYIINKHLYYIEKDKNLIKKDIKYSRFALTHRQNRNAAWLGCVGWTGLGLRIGASDWL